MMKKLLSLFTVCLLFICLFVTSASAKSALTFNDDFTALTFNEQTYERFNDSLVTAGYSDELDCHLALTPSQQAAVDDIDLYTNEECTIIWAEVTYPDGALLSLAFLREDCLTAYEQLENGTFDAYTVDFFWPEGNTVSLPRSAVPLETVTLSSWQLTTCEAFDVAVQSSEPSLSFFCGSLLVIGDEFYYADYAENHLDYWEFQAPEDHAPLTAHPVTDPDAVQNLRAGWTSYNNDFLLFGDGAEVLTLIVCVLLFAVLPLVLFVVFLVLALRSGHPYRELCAAVCALAVAILLVFALTAFFLIAG